MKKRFVFILIFMFMFVVSFTLNVYASSTKRLAGETRYDTSASIARDGWKQSNYAILAYGENYPDALGVVPLAKKYDAPIVLTNGTNLPTVSKETLIDLQVKNVFIIGGTAVIPSSIDAELQSMEIIVTRIAGQDRYDTAIKVAQQLPSPTEIFVTTGEDFPDALSLAPIAALKQVPIILVPKDYLPDSVKAYLSANEIIKTFVVGNSDIIEDSIINQFPGSERIIGVNRYARNINVNEKFDHLFSSPDISIATGEGFADAITGAAYAAKQGMPIVLVNDDPLAYTRIFTVHKLNTDNPNNGDAYVFGGQIVVPDNVVAYLYTLPATDQPNRPMGTY
ncbi:cell wall-binding repeat-containing protein [Desulfosporosinus sp. BICA1-9]|uniref:cell wall-binding repeat-containing protein n=1 Tax=Desulfosporosinus sp. BICA1-9 TaxID=1531958 RepID=UPI0025BB998E|nr:cell wall-binding repeat-containing protein [Desulfosporosinus sp. BICA1-9]